jgi:branched-chain amino acid transport system substrate-binding protein
MQSIPSKTLAITTAAVLFAVALAGCHGPAHGEGLVLGSLLPITGGLSPYGPDARAAVEMAIAHVNAAGGVNGEDVRHVSADSETNPEAARSAFQHLINNERIHALIGPMGSPQSLAVIASVIEAGIPMISPSNTGPDFTTIEDGGWYFRTVPSDALQGAVMANLVRDHGHERVAIIAADDAYGTGFGDVFRSRFEAGGGTITNYVRYDPEGLDFSSDVQTAAGGNAEAIVFIGYPDAGRVLIQNAFERGHIGPESDLEWYFSEGFRSQEFVDGVHGEQSGILNGYWGTTPEENTNSQFVSDFENRTGRTPALFADRTYDAAILLMLAAEHCGCTDGAGIRDALMEVQNPPGEEVSYNVTRALELVRNGEGIYWTGAAGPMEFDSVGDVTAPYAIWRIVDGRITDQERGIRP